ncbi:MAG: ABC transporter ATP-binding protein [Acidimicrobiales bacterium]
MTPEVAAAPGPPSAVPAVQLAGVTKRFGAVTACDGVDLSLHRGEIHGVLGENGAGKSTLLLSLAGLVVPDAGTVRLDGRPVRIRSPHDAHAHGIALVHQHLSLVPALTVWENVALGGFGPLRPHEVRAQVREIGERYGIEIDPDAPTGALSAGQRQRVEIIRCLARHPRVLLLDEPTALLTPRESERLFDSLRRLIEIDGTAVAFVSHKLGEVLRVTDRVTVMRHGRVVDHRATAAASGPDLARAIVGVDHAAAVGAPTGTRPAPAPAVRLRLRAVTTAATDVGSGLDGVSLTVGAGEVLGIAGIDGNGQRPLADLLSGLTVLGPNDGVVEVDGRAIDTAAVGAMVRAHVAVIPEDRHDSGVVADMSVAENLVLVRPGRAARHGLLDRRRVRLAAEASIAEFAITCAGPDAPLWTLSGGNQQRVVLARELGSNPRVLVVAQPTRGLDLAAAADVRARIAATAASGVAVLLISNDLDEILELADRIAVISRGRIVGESSRQDADAEWIGRRMGGEDG